MKNLITKAFGIAGITALSFLPMNGKGQDVLDGVWIPGDFSKLNKSQRDSLCWEIIVERASLIGDMKSLSVEYQEKKNLHKEKIDSLNGSLNLYMAKYNFLKRKANRECNSNYYDLDCLYLLDFDRDTSLIKQLYTNNKKIK